MIVAREGSCGDKILSCDCDAFDENECFFVLTGLSEYI